MRWNLTTPPAVEPVRLEEALIHCNLASAGGCAADVAKYIQGLITKARTVVEESENRQLITAVWEVYEDQFSTGKSYLEIDGRLPLQSVDKIEYINQLPNTYTEWPAEEYEVDAVDKDRPGRIRPQTGYVWPTAEEALNAVRYTLTCGYGDTADDVPETARTAILYLVAQMYAVREPITPLRITKVPNDVMERSLDLLYWGDYR